ncbi:MAG TPA: long-chain fatty acid--CoA ligase [Acidobacteriota bacterium]|nr:long-chain fatty acid--CoA ligase [Acidobacteriota bacterium]
MKTLCDILDRVAADGRSELLYVRPPGADAFDAWGAADLLAHVDRCASGLRDLGIGRGSRVGLISSNRPEWHVVDFACHRLGATLVPLFPTLAAAQVADCFRRSKCRVVVVDSPEQAAKVALAADDSPELTTLVALDGTGDQQVDMPTVNWNAFLPATGSGDFDGPESADSVATIIFTSGTSGPPKGVMLTHRNLIANVEGVMERSPVEATDVALSLLPLCHVYERTLDYCYLAAGARIAYSDPSELSTDFMLVRPTLMVGVPRLYEKLRQAIEDRAQGSRLYVLALRIGMQRARASLSGEPEGLLNKLLHPVVERLVLSRIRGATGGRMRLMSAGGAALDPDLNWWYAAMGWELVQGYGLTESAPVISTNTLGDNRIGTVGKPLDNVEVRLAHDNEIVARGPSIMKGYLDDPEATAEALRDDWLFTGDVGTIEPGGYLRITDRKKAILVTSTGKNVAPQSVETVLSGSPWVEQVMAVGNDRRFVSALIVPVFARLEAWAAERGLGSDRAALCASQEVRALFAGELERLQANMARYESARAFRLVDRPFTVAEGHLTPTMKLVRHRVEEDFADLIEEMYVH